MLPLRIPIVGIVLCVGSLFLFSACAPKSNLRQQAFAKDVYKGNYSQATQKIVKNEGLYSKKDAFLYHMDLGALYHYKQQYDSSNIHLEQCTQIYSDLYTKSTTKQFASALVNDNVLDYRGRLYEIVAVHQLMAFNYLAQDKPYEALVEARRAQLLFDSWKERSTSKYHDDGMFHYLAALNYQLVGEADNSLISLFQSVRAYQNGVIPLPKEVEKAGVQEFLQNERQGDIQRLGLPKALKGPHLLQKPPAGKGRIIVLGHLGQGPLFSETTWWGTYSPSGALVFYHKDAQGKTQSFAVADEVFRNNQEYQKAQNGGKTDLGTTYHLKFSMPAFHPRPTKSHAFNIQAYHSTHANPQVKSIKGPESIVLTNYDKLAAQSLKDQKTETVIRTVLRVLIRTAATHAAKKKLQTDSPLLNLVTNLGIDFLSDELEKADTRNSFVLPKTVQLSYLHVPVGEYNLKVNILDKKGSTIETKDISDVAIGSEETRFIFVTSVR
jgi:hypothetical protein